MYQGFVRFKVIKVLACRTYAPTKVVINRLDGLVLNVLLNKHISITKNRILTS